MDQCSQKTPPTVPAPEGQEKALPSSSLSLLSPPVAEIETRRPSLGQLRRWLQTLWQRPVCRVLLATALAVGVGVRVGQLFVGSVYIVQGRSMEPTYPAGTHLYGAPISTPLERGDVVLLDDGHREYAVKRIVGLPGETVQLWRGHVFVNREMLVEPYLPKHVYTYPAEPERRGATFVLAPGQYLVLGDNRPSSSDSRDYGPVERKQIKRRVPLPEYFVCAYFAPYTLPDYGKTLIRPLGHRPIGVASHL